MPMSERHLRVRPAKSVSAKVTVPDCGTRAAAASPNNVLLPAPFAPSTPTVSPGDTRRFAPRMPPVAS